MVTRRISGPRREFPSGDTGTPGMQRARLYEDYYENFYKNPPVRRLTKFFRRIKAKNSVIRSTRVQRPVPR